jgi:hypothetical protein
MNEVVPLVFGLGAGLALGVLTSQRRPIVWVLVSVVLGASATFLTGEWRLSWAFVLVDIPLVALSAATAYLLARRTTSRVLEARANQ